MQEGVSDTKGGHVVFNVPLKSQPSRSIHLSENAIRFSSCYTLTKIAGSSEKPAETKVYESIPAVRVFHVFVTIIQFHGNLVDGE
jgi:hypothetical protein